MRKRLRGSAVAAALWLAGSYGPAAGAPGAGTAAQPPEVPNLLVPRIVVRQVGTARAGGYATVEVSYENLGGDGTYGTDFGDGRSAGDGTMVDSTCGGPKPGFGGAPERLTHAYRYPGQWTVTAYYDPKCADRSLPRWEGKAVVTVQPGSVSSNGPYWPISQRGSGAMQCTPASSKTPRTLSCLLDEWEEDGYVTRSVVRWGDGSPPTVLTYPLSRCREPRDTWPATYDTGSRPRHTYARNGRYRASLSVTSSGCDGKHRQSRTVLTRVVVGEPE